MKKKHKHQRKWQLDDLLIPASPLRRKLSWRTWTPTSSTPGSSSSSRLTAAPPSTGSSTPSVAGGWTAGPGRRWASPCSRTTRTLWCQSFLNLKKFPLQTFIIYASTRAMWWISSGPASRCSFPPLTVMTASDPTWTQFNFRYQLAILSMFCPRGIVSGFRNLFFGLFNFWLY